MIEFLQHVLPRRLQKIRYYGFLSRRANIDLDDVRAAILDSLRDVERDPEFEDCRVLSLVRETTGNKPAPAPNPVHRRAVDLPSRPNITA